MSTTPYSFIRQGNLFIVPVGPTVGDAPYPTQSFTKPPDYSVWVRGQIQAPGVHLDQARMAPRLYQEVRDDLVRYSPVEVTRSAIRRSEHAYVGVIDSRGVPYYFALDSRGVSVREAVPDDVAWKAFDRLADEELRMGLRQRREAAVEEVRDLSNGVALIVTKGLKYGKKVEWKHDVPHSSWWRKPPKDKKPKQESHPGDAESAEKSEDGRRQFGNWYASEMRRLGHELWLQVNDGESELDPPRPDDVTNKALPKKAKSDGAKKAPSSKAAKKQAGAGGKTRYTYPQEKSGARKPAGGQVPLIVVHDDTRHADPAELANQLGVSVRTLRRTADRLGSDGFASFMRSRLKTFAAKHRLDPDYWGTLYANLMASPDGAVMKSEHDAAWKQFGDNVKKVASAVPHDHPERFGDRKVFIHHVHHEMKRRGMYSGSLDEFKDHVVHAHQKGHLVAARADFVQAMDPKSVRQSETGSSHGAQFHFINNVKHDPEASKEPAAHKTEEPSKPKARPALSRGPLRDIAHLHSEEANEASRHAHNVRTPEAHLAAMTAHHHAGVAHQKATGKVSDKTALKHFDQSMAHHKASKG